MKKFAALLLIAGFISMPGFAHGRKKDKEVRKEERRIERAIRDSLRAVMVSADSVNVGYGYTKKSTLTNAVTSVDMNSTAVTGYSDIGEYLRGRVPGLTVIKNGARYRFIIRGVSTVNGPSEPLFIVDGVEMEDISYLNPSHIKSVEVLKDSSSSIYGVRGAYGVILITTRR